MNISAVVMAAGFSERMRADKLHMEINNKKIYEHILETIKKYNFYEILVVAKDDDILKKAHKLGFVGVKNDKYYLGQSESVKASLRAAKETHGYMFFVADQPFIKLSTVEKLCNEFYNNPDNIIVPFYNGIKGNPVIFPSFLKCRLLKLEGDIGGKAVINDNPDKVINVNIETDFEHIDIDTVEDYNTVKNIKVVNNDR